MKILIVSDTHNNISLLKKVLSENKSDLLFHLGDYYDDAMKADFSQYCPTIYRVPGIFHTGYRNRSIPATQTVDVMGFNIQLVHSIEDANLSKLTDSIVFYGHTHVHQVQKYKSNILINPGHLKSMEDRNQKASYLILQASSSELIIDWYQVETGLIKTYKINKNKDNKLELKI